MVIFIHPFFLQGSDTPSVVQAGLPNITGSIGVVKNNGTTPTQTGCFSWTEAGIKDVGDYADNGRIENIINFNASRSSNIYGASSTVQPPTLSLIPQVKY